MFPEQITKQPLDQLGRQSSIDSIERGDQYYQSGFAESENLPIAISCRASQGSHCRVSKSGDYSKWNKLLQVIFPDCKDREKVQTCCPLKQRSMRKFITDKAQIFIVLRNFYSILSLVLLLLAFIDNVRTKKSKIITGMLDVSIALLGLGLPAPYLEWYCVPYLLGYAPWSNGYEALLLVAWGTLLAGFSFIRYSKITLEQLLYWLSSFK